MSERIVVIIEVRAEVEGAERWDFYAAVEAELGADERIERRLHDAKLDHAVRLRGYPISEGDLGALVERALSSRHLGWPVSLDDIERRELERTVRLHGRALERIETLLGELVAARRPEPRDPERALQQTEDGLAAAARAYREVERPAPAITPAREVAAERVVLERERAEDPVMLEPDFTTSPPQMLANGQPAVPVIRKDGSYSEQIGAGSAANVTSRGWGIGGAAPTTAIERIEADGTISKQALPRVGDSLRPVRSRSDL